MTNTGQKTRMSRKIGLSPGSLIHIGEHRGEPVVVTQLTYVGDTSEEHEIARVDAIDWTPDRPGVTWINVSGVHDISIVEQIGKRFSLHPLLLEDIVNTTQRPKTDEYPDRLYVVVKMFRQVRHDDEPEIEAEQVSVVLGPNFVLTFQETVGDVFDPVRQRIRAAKGHICNEGADYLAYALIDTIVDRYYTILEEIGDATEGIEDGILENPTTEALQAVYELKRALVAFRRGVWPLREAIAALERYGSDLVRPDTLPYLRDVHDHTLQVADAIDTYRDMMSGMIDLYMSSVSNRMNQVMKVLTVIATIFIPLTFIAGVYGMNFVHMPELHWLLGYPAVLLLMAVVTGGLLLAFRRNGWL
ncbi:MAG: magnesium/cobalt transporter CorA [Gemmatimonadales bacterium]